MKAIFCLLTFHIVFWNMKYSAISGYPVKCDIAWNMPEYEFTPTHIFSYKGSPYMGIYKGERSCVFMHILLRLTFNWTSTLREKCPNTEFFLVRIQSEKVKHGPGKTPLLDNFYAVPEIAKNFILQKTVFFSMLF